MTCGFHTMPGILTYSTAHFNFLPSWSLHSCAPFPLTHHEDQSHHTLHPFTCHNQKNKPFRSSIISWILVSLLFSVSPNLINVPFPRPSQILCYSTVPSTDLCLLCSPFKKRFLFSYLVRL